MGTDGKSVERRQSADHALLPSERSAYTRVGCKTSGSKGLQVYVPLNTAITYDETKDLSRTLAQHLEHDHADRVTSNMSKAVRKGKVFVYWIQNDEHKTTVC